MKRRLAHALKRTARLLIKWANRIDGPIETLYDEQWRKIDNRLQGLVDAGQYPSKGVARRALGFPDPPAPTKDWFRRIAAGVANVRPAIPNSVDPR